ncbi:hypothetical protein GUA87_06015 [Sneathiella sp. P13V-1]|uniref:VCBS domain-containing protein n=1 Tax=Sneathiella sp. P13V-1 TaxID=2697366 RepID=UPI00187B4CBF|nr:VCBS domain-containing protein [Sneathiella sp. P13V-1]MBE7636393.1 hypothetical protein [Sneathiella sp. P13V-1]
MSVTLSQTEQDFLNQASQDFGNGVVNLGRSANLFGMNSFTLSVTLNLNSLSGGNQRVLWNHTQYGIVVNNDDLQVALRGADGNLNYYTVPNAFDATGWHDIQVVYDDTSDALKLYVDGEEVYSTITSDVDISEPSYWDVTAGGTLWGDMLDGEVADVSILDTAEEIDPSQSLVERMMTLDETDTASKIEVAAPDTTPTTEPKTQEELLAEAAVEFGDGTVSLGNDPSLFNLDDLTISATFSLDTLSGGKQMLVHSQGQYAVYVYRDDLFVRFRDENGKQIRTRIRDAFEETGWHDVQVTVDKAANALNIFLDGDLLLTKSANWIELGVGTNYGVTAGGNQWGNELQGDIADVSIHSEALDVDSSLSLYDRMYALDDGNLAPKYEVPSENTAAVIGGEDTVFMAEDDLAVSGKLSIEDADAGEALFAAGTYAAAHGQLVLDADGNWTFVPDSASLQSLGEGDTATDTVTITSVDGTEHTITVTFEGSNDVPVITGVASGSVAEEGPLSTSGKLDIADVDAGESAFVAAAVDGVYGTLVIDADGNWSYNASGNAELAALGAGENAIDAITVKTVDGTSQLIAINVTGSDSQAVISGVDTGVIEEDGARHASGKLDVVDADAGESSFVASSVEGNYGVLSIDAAGNWSYSIVNQAAVEAMSEGDVAVETLTVETLGGASHQISIELRGSNDAAEITGSSSAQLVEDGDLSASGKLDIADVDAGEAAFVAGSTGGTYGNLVIDAAGNWTYTAATTAAVQALAAGEIATETFTVESLDGTAHTLTMTMEGTNDTAVISGVAVGSVAEDGPLTTSGKLNVSDVDTGEGAFEAAALSGTYGTLVIDAEGNWSYSATETEALQALSASDSVAEAITVRSLDGTEQVITITVSGSDSEAVITGVDTGLVVDDGTPTVSGKLDVTDEDAGQSAFVADTIDGDLGTLVIDAAGNWIYQANESTALSALGAGETLTDTVQVLTVGGTSHTITITLEGTDDVPVITGIATGNIGEDGPLTAAGKLDIVDLDAGESAFVAGTVNGTFGVLTIDAAGNWTYDASGNAALEALGAGDVVTDDVQVRSVDGTIKTITITVTGSDSEAVISGVDTGTITEDAVVSASGKLDVTDKDSGESSFVAGTVTGVYGALAIDALGNWTYEANNASLQSLGAGDVAVENLTVQTADGSTHVIAISLEGANDAAVITGSSTGLVEEDGNLTANGKLDITDADQGEAAFEAGTVVGAYGSVEIDAVGNWTYTANNGANMQALNTGDVATDTLTVHALDGTAHQINIAVTGQDEPVDPGTGDVIIVSTSEELLAALKNAEGGEEIQLMPGEYGRVDIMNLAPAQQVTISAFDDANPPTFTQFVISNSHNLTIDNVEVRPLDVPPVYMDKYLMLIDGGSNIEITNSLIQGDPSIDYAHFAGVFYQNTTDVEFSGNELRYLERGAIFNGVTRADITENNVHSNTMDGFNFVQVKDLLIEKNLFHEFYPAEGVHPDYIQFWTTGSTESSENVIIRDNQMYQSEGGFTESIFMRDQLGNMPYKNFLIENNLIYQEHYHGITVMNVEGFDILNNTVISQTDTSQLVAIRVLEGNDVTIEGNITSKLVTEGITELTVDNNIIATKDGLYGSEKYEDIFVGSLEKASMDPSLFDTFGSIASGADVDIFVNSDLEHIGSGLSDVVFGEDTNDTIFGFRGDDTLYGEAGDDLLVGGAGRDILFGGEGADTFLFEKIDDGGISSDTIADFNASMDKVSFEGLADIPLEYVGSSEFNAVDFSTKTAEEWFDIASNQYPSGGTEVEVPDLTSNGSEFTISATYFVNELKTTSQTILWKEGHFGIVTKNEYLFIALRNQSGGMDYITVNGVMSPGEWHDTQIVVNGDQLEIVFDGTSVFAGDATKYDLFADVDQPVFAGAKQYGSELDGQVADVSFVDRALDLSEQATLLERTTDIDDQDLWEHMNFSEGSGEIRFDDQTNMLQVDLDGDTKIDFEVEMLGVQSSDLNSESFIF